MDPEVFLDLYNNLETKLKGRGSYYNGKRYGPSFAFRIQVKETIP